jgi:hypothetical protein
MASTSIQPKYDTNNLPYRFPNLIENNGISKFDFFYSTTNKTFLFKDKNSSLTNVTIDFIKVDNMFVTNKTLINP